MIIMMKVEKLISFHVNPEFRRIKLAYSNRGIVAGVNQQTLKTFTFP